GAYALRSRGKQLRPRALPQGPGRVGGDPERGSDVLEARGLAQVPGVVFEVRRAIQPEAAFDDGVFVVVEAVADLVALPDVEAAFLAFGVGVERAPEAAVGGVHLADEPSGALARGVREPRVA